MSATTTATATQNMVHTFFHGTWGISRNHSWGYYHSGLFGVNASHFGPGDTFEVSIFGTAYGPTSIGVVTGDGKWKVP